MNIIKKVEKILSDAGLEEAGAEAKMIVLEISKLSFEDLLLQKELNCEDKIIKTAELRAKTKKPLQHILGCAYFMGSRYKVTPDVLIPRDETELLVRRAVELLSGKKNAQNTLNILDIGTGSGCISIEIAKKIDNTEILAIDISSDALRVALENIELHDVIRKVIVRKSDLFSKIRDEEKFDLIISNPPYIPLAQKGKLQEEVKFEPDCALFAPDVRGVEYYKKIIEDAPKYLKAGGFIAFELGAGQAKNVYRMLEDKFCDIEIIHDMAAVERVISAKMK